MMRILIVDDHEVVRRGLRQILTEALAPIEIGDARDSREACERLMNDRWDMVLLDINLPGRSGLELLLEIRRLAPETPALVLSAFPEEDYAFRALKSGAAGYLTKQSAADELLLAIRKVLAGGRYVTAALAERLAARLGAELEFTPHEALSNRELQVLRLVASGKTLKEAAVALSLSEKTIGTYRSRISEKLGLSSNVELTRYALRHRLVD